MEAAFRVLVEETRAKHNISDVVGRWTNLKRAGPRELVGCCCFHDERTPSLRVNDERGVYHCFGCGAEGDIIRFVQEKLGASFIDALRWLGAADLPVIGESERTKRRHIAETDRLQSIQDARGFFADADNVAGTKGHAYLRARSINALPPITVRFGMVPSWRNAETGQWGRRRPALIFGCQDRSGGFVGVQRIFVDGPEPDKAACKLTLGRVRGCPVRLGPVAPEIVLTEGPEDGLTLFEALPGLSVWVTCGTGLLPHVDLPPEVRSIVLAGQNNTAGKRAVDVAAEAYLAQGLAVRAMYPDAAFDDWNDEKRGRRK